MRKLKKHLKKQEDLTSLELQKSISLQQKELRDEIKDWLKKPQSVKKGHDLVSDGWCTPDSGGEEVYCQRCEEG